MFLSKNTGYMLNERTYSNIIIGIFIVKLLFALFFVLYNVLNYKFKNPTPTQTYYLEKLNYWNELFDIFFRTSVSILLIYLFVPQYYSQKIKHIDYETALLLFIYGIFLLMDNIGATKNFYHTNTNSNNKPKHKTT